MQFKFAAAAAVERMYLLILFVCPGNWLLLQCLWLNFERTKGKESKIIIIKKKRADRKAESSNARERKKERKQRRRNNSNNNKKMELKWNEKSGRNNYAQVLVRPSCNFPSPVLNNQLIPLVHSSACFISEQPVTQSQFSQLFPIAPSSCRSSSLIDAIPCLRNGMFPSEPAMMISSWVELLLSCLI